MPAVSVDGHMTNLHSSFLPGTASQSIGSFTVAGKGVLRKGDAISTHGHLTDPKLKHILPSISQGAATFTVAGKPIVRLGDGTSCGAKMAQGISSFTVG
ncbi:Zn-binding Pro-Ala-Ala-Arg (PAAR) domain-containing protein, incolved in TypeVI secretion [Pseudoalteromonas denitrificans DSM 6059]|uniref:Zn-binding Pro-Ala-Ala-Arg (PAAR) domain-containing protein, incolved in TypeVI secretion n=2 Tax=Pseudoalteromonas TaxID=53246 RepID=A0A1I1Q4V0_9GAMM|nr:Zn-binding Pro-Ala-Ala-Arg (PAAR) domain-containing protein, incolved in TypeVI secretion [Pseudoalteromonas denitrificans DSM 6059]